jgi:hypothetical protein
MRALTATATVRPDHTLTLQVPDDVAPGTHDVVVVFQDEASSSSAPVSSAWPAPYNTGPIDPNMTFRREDIYGDDGR